MDYQKLLKWEYFNDDMTTLCGDCHKIAHGIFEGKEPELIGNIIKRMI